MNEYEKALTFVDRYGVSSTEPVEQPERIFNVLLTRKAKGKRTEQTYLALLVPPNTDEHIHIRQVVRESYFGWLLAGYAPVKTEQEE